MGTDVGFSLAADGLVLLHLCFVLFAVFGGLLVARWPRVAFMHLPAAAWAAWIELSGGVCPLTPLENSLRERAGETVYVGGFVEHHVLPLLYPLGLTTTVQAVLGLAVLVVNVAIYAWVLRRRRR